MEIRPGVTVYSTDGPVGTVGHVHRDPASREITGFVLHFEPDDREHVFIPSEWIAEAGLDRVVLLVSWTEVLKAGNPRQDDSIP